MPLGRHLKQLRNAAGLSVREAAHMIGKSPGYLSKIETRGEIPTAELLLVFAEKYKVDIDELFRAAKEDYLERVEQDIDSRQEQALALFRKEKR